MWNDLTGGLFIRCGHGTGVCPDATWHWGLPRCCCCPGNYTTALGLAPVQDVTTAPGQAPMQHGGEVCCTVEIAPTTTKYATHARSSGHEPRPKRSEHDDNDDDDDNSSNNNNNNNNGDNNNDKHEHLENIRKSKERFKTRRKSTNIFENLEKSKQINMNIRKSSNNLRNIYENL